jgi:hypothetical protein
MIDASGRLFGRFNVVDVAAIAFVVFLIPVGYAAYLLFRPTSPSIESVTRVEVTKEERRVAGGSMLTAKLKVRGAGFNPLLRARIGDAETLGFVFETPNSADVLVGVVPPGKHDLVLYDGVQEVARAREAVDVPATASASVRAYGWLTRLAPAQAAALAAGFTSDPNAPGAFEIVSIGDARPAKSRINAGGHTVDLPVEGMIERPAEIVVRCDWPGTAACTIGGVELTADPPLTLTLPGGFTFEADQIAPPSEPVAIEVRVEIKSGVPFIKAGDRDAAIGRVAEVVNVSGAIATLRMGANESREGWRYRGQLIAPGASFTLRTSNYVASGMVVSVQEAATQ